MNKQKMIATLKQNFMIKRYKAQEECENFISKLREDVEFDDLYFKLTKAKLEYAKADLIEDNLRIKREIDELKTKINNFLAIKNINPEKLKPNYDCKICNDTGVVGGRICKCLLDELNMKISLQTSSQTQFKSFDNLNLQIMDNADIKASEWLKTWCLRFPEVSKVNVNIIGGAGCGKTFLLECVANELMNKGCAVCYKTAFEINDLARQYHIGKSYNFSDCINADVLLIDDLGTEPVLKNVTKEYLYNLINIRQINNKPTFITTNLSLDDIISRYDERIFSRLANKNLSATIKLNSKDKRIN